VNINKISAKQPEDMGEPPGQKSAFDMVLTLQKQNSLNLLFDG
jgi:hypothetical protein